MDTEVVNQEVFRTCNKLFCSKTLNEMRGTEAHPSNIETAAEMESVQHFSAHAHHLHHVEVARDGGHDEGGRGGAGAEVMSGVICVNILILGSALVTGSAINSVAITAVHRQIFLIVLLLLTSAWMLFYTVSTHGKDRAVLYKDGHAGPVWLRAGLVLFGLLSLIMDMFKIANYVGYLHCDSPVKVAFPAVQAVFLFIQTHFLWIHAKDCVQIHTILTRCGLTLTLSTNLTVWMAAVAEESVHQTDIPENVMVLRNTYRAASYGNSKCNCSYSSCSIFEEAYYYLYPFNIEYSLFASAMAYVMWKNVGRLVEDHSHHHHHIKFRVRDVAVGPVLGILLVLAGLAAFILYEFQVVKEDKKQNALLLHFVTNIVIVSLMSISTMIGCVVYWLDRRERVSDKNPTRSLDVGLLVGASIGQFLISYFTAVAVVATGAEGHLNALNLAWAVLTVVQLALQNFFIIKGLHREPYHTVHATPLHANVHDAPGHCGEISQAATRNRKKYSLAPTRHKFSWKRRILKEVCAFLLLTNIILWIMPAFGARPQFDHSTETDFYHFSLWAAIVNIGLPFGIFYRMHSVASLFEVYVLS